MRRWLPITLAVSLSAGMLVHAADDLVYSRFSDYVEALRVQAGIPGVAAAVVGVGDVQWEKTFGLADVDRNLPVRMDTPFAVDGLTQMFSASLVLRCVSDGWFTLNQQVDGGTLGELLSHTSPGPNGPVFSYRLDRLGPVAQTIAGCTKTSFPGAVASLLDSMAMVDAVPGADAATSWQDSSARSRYAGAVGRLATPYSVDSRGRATASSVRDANLDAGRWSHRIDPRPRTVRSRNQTRLRSSSRFPCHRLDAADRFDGPALAARNRLVRAVIQRRTGGLAIRRRRQYDGSRDADQADSDERRAAGDRLDDLRRVQAHRERPRAGATAAEDCHRRADSKTKPSRFSPACAAATKNTIA